MAIGYHGTFHLKANDRPELSFLYLNFIEKNPDLCIELSFKISEILIKAFSEVRKKFSGDNNGYSGINSRQPMIVDSGKLITSSDGRVAVRFNNSFIQIPIRAQESHGIRICVEIELLNLVESGYIFYYGHRSSDQFISLKYNSGSLVAIYKNKNKEHKLLHRVDGLRKMFKVEVSVYSRGSFLIAVNERLEEVVDTNTKFEIKNGKLMLGSNLSGQINGSFLETCISIEALSAHGILTDIFLWSVKQILSNQTRVTRNFIVRPCLRS